MKKMTFFLLALPLLLLASCGKDDDLSNDETFKCKVNGEEWDAFSYTEGDLFGIGTGAMDLLYYTDVKSITLIGVRHLEDQSTNQSINISTKPVSLGDNPIYVNNVHLIKRVFKDWNNDSGCIFYNLDTLSENTIHIIEIDSINRRIEGTFLFSAINDCNDVVRVTDGYFDIAYRF